MKKFILFAFIFLAAFNFSYAQKKAETPQAAAERYTKSISPKLKLTADQETKIQAFALQYYTAKDDNKTKYASDSKGLAAADRESSKTFQANVNTVLNADQQKQYADIVKGRREGEAPAKAKAKK